MDITQNDDKSVLANEMKKICDKKYVGDDYMYSCIDNKLIVAKKTDTTEVMSSEVKIVDKDYASYRVNHIIIISVYDCKNLTEIENHDLKNILVRYGSYYKTIYPAFYKATMSIDGENKTWHENGRVETIYYTFGGYKTGVYKRFYFGGALEEVSNWSKGLKEGTCEQFYKNGKVKRKSNYKFGVLHGLHEYFYETGRLFERSEWDNGRRMGLFLIMMDEERGKTKKHVKKN